jgi:phage terminase large subunit GpA-like protein
MADGGARLFNACARSVAPRKAITVSEWADEKRVLSEKGSARPGKWRTSANPPLREPMDCLSARSPVQDITLRFPIQFGKTEVAVNGVGYCIDENPGPLMIALPGEVPMQKWISQKLNPMLDETPAVKAALTSTASRDASNTRTFKDFAGGQLYMEHAGSPSRLKLTSVRTLVVDELDEFALNFIGGDDPVDMLDGRTSAFPATFKRLYIGTPTLKGVSRIDKKYEASDQRRFYVRCPHCGHEQPLEWRGLQWELARAIGSAPAEVSRVWYLCRESACVIEEYQKTEMIACGRWVAENPGARTRGYTINCLYYQIGLGPRWADLVRMWLDAQNDPAKLKTFINDRLAEAFEDPAMRKVKSNVVLDRAEPYRLRSAPQAVLTATAGVDTQDDRFEVQIVGWSRTLQAWTLDYVVIPGDPERDETRAALADLLNKPIEHASGRMIRVEAVAIDAGGHRTESVKAFVRSGVVRRALCIFGAVPSNAPILSRGKLQDINWRGQLDKRGVTIHHVGTVGIKHLLYSRISTDEERESSARLIHLSDELPDEFFTGLVAETFNPVTNRFVKRGGVRNEPLDTWTYAYAATHHPELRLHRRSRMDWDAIEARLKPQDPSQVHHETTEAPATNDTTSLTVRNEPKRLPPARRRGGGFARSW